MNKEQIRELADKIIADYKEHYDFPTQGESHMHDCIVGDLEEFAQLEKAPEPEWVHLEFTGKETIATSLYTSPPEVAELRKNFQAAIEFEKNASKADRILLLEYKKQVQALQAENEKLRANPELDLFKRYLKESDEALLFDERLKGKV